MSLFDFPAAEEPTQIFLYVLNACYFTGYVFLSVLLFLRRGTRFMRPRFPPTLFLFLTFELCSLVISSASIIVGKAPTCLPLEVLYCTATFFTFHFIVSPAVLFVISKVNEEKRTHLTGNSVSLLWRMVPYISSITWRLVAAFLAGSLQGIVYLIVRFVAPLEGDCNRTAILILGCFQLALAVSGIVANCWLRKVQDPIFWKTEITIAGLLNSPNVIIIPMYSFDPAIFPAWFDFRWLNVFNSLVTLLVVVALPLSLSNPKIEAFVKKVFKMEILDQDDLDVRTNNFLFSLNSRVDELQAVLDHSILREAFLSYCSRLWCCENVLFLLEVQDFRSNFQDSDTSRALARRIAAQYLTRDGALEINLLDSTRSKVLQALDLHFNAEVFLSAEKEITTLVKSDSLKKWYMTSDFRDVLRRVVSNRNSSNLASFEMSVSINP